MTGAGRTDQGVHAWGQVVSFDARADRFEPDRLRRSVNRLCGPALVVSRGGGGAPTDFDARFSARSRRYHYTVLNRPVADPFLLGHVVARRRAARLWPPCASPADPFIGEHDFSSFCRRPRPGRAAADGAGRAGGPRWCGGSLDAGWDDLGDGLLRFDVEATSFCHQMVRSIVGMLVEVGRGRRRAGEIAGIMRARDRGGLPTLAPPAVCACGRSATDGAASDGARSAVLQRFVAWLRRRGWGQYQAMAASLVGIGTGVYAVPGRRRVDRRRPGGRGRSWPSCASSAASSSSLPLLVMRDDRPKSLQDPALGRQRHPLADRRGVGTGSRDDRP